MSFEVFEVKDLQWGFHSEPSVQLDTLGYKRSDNVDPFPCYAHNIELVKVMMEQVTKTFPIKQLTRVFNLHYEDLGRTNAYMSYNTDHDSEETPKSFFPYIVINGKRIPPHPAMTRYLVAHEYGHVVEKWIEYCRKTDDIRTEYMALRGMSTPTYYGGRTWHKSVGEVFANDFRILVCGVEPEYWVHDVPYPTDVPEIVEYWKEALQYKYLDK